nr:RING finger 17-like protein [Limnephilus lunatus]
MEAIKVAPCCNCCQPFGVNGIGYPMKGRLPYLLQCGHSVCEKCIFSTIKNFHGVKCHQCQTKTLLSKEEMVTVIGFSESFKMFIPLNFYILGILIFNNSRVEPTKQTGFILPAGHSVQQPHRYKGHQHQPLQSNHYNPPFTQDFQKKLPPKKDYGKFLKSLWLCPEHPDKNCELYCSDCCKTICTQCLVKTCGKHAFSLVSEKNEQFINDIKVHKKTTNDVMLRMKKTVGELEKKRSLTSLGSVDTKSTETLLAEHFDRFHGVLQKMENSLIAEIKSSKNYLNDLIKGLHDSAKDLSDLINAVDYFTEPEKQKEVNLHKVAEELERTANLPWFLEEDVKNIKPTIKLNIDEDIFKIVEKHCQIESNNSSIKLLSTTELPTYVELPPVPDDIACETASVHSTGSSHSSRKTTAFPVGARAFKDLNFGFKTKPDKVLIASNPIHETQAEKKHEKFIKPLIVGLTEKVVVTHIDSPHDFFIQRAVMLPKIKEMSDTYNSMKSSLVEPSDADMFPGTMFVLYDSEQHRWDRVNMVRNDSSSDKENGEYKVKFVDFGNMAIVNIKRLRIAPKEPFFPVYCHRCTLIGCQPKTEKWTDEANLLMYRIVQKGHGECLMNVIRIENEVLEVDIVSCAVTLNECTTSVTEALIFLDHACYGDPKNQVNRNNPLTGPKQYFHHQNLGDNAKVLVTHIESPASFYVRKSHLLEYFEQLTKDLNLAYKLSDTTGEIYTPKLGMCVACYVDDVWWRARVTNVCEKKNLEVLLVDSGRKASVPYSSIRMLQLKFIKIDELVTRCALGDIKPFGNNWMPEATAFMKSFLKNDPICAIKHCALKHTDIHKHKRHVPSNKVLLYLNPEDEDEVCLNHELVKNDLAVSTQAPVQILTKQVNVVKPTVSNMKTDKDTEVTANGPLKLEVQILSALTPSDVYISINSEEVGLRNLYKEMQIFYADSQPDDSIVWKQGDKCAVLPINEMWSRAIVESVDENSKMVKVFLKDHARLTETTQDNLRLLGQNFMKVRDGALKCHLSGIIPASGDKWPMLTCETLQDICKQYHKFYITKDGEISNKSLPIELWVYHTTPGGALTPTIKEWRKVNTRILEEGLAVPDRIFKSKPSPVEAPSTSSAIPQQLEVVSLDSTPYTLNVGEENSAPVRHEDWLPAEPLKSKEFMAVGTYVEEDLTIYLYDMEQSTATMELLSRTLTSHFTNSKPKPHDMFWVPGQICITKYNLDQKYYRAKVLSISEHHNNAEVLFVDYGNKQDCPISSLRKDVVCHHIPIQTQVCKLYNVKPVEGDVWESKIGDFVHQNVVEKECQVTVMGEAINGVIPIALKLGRLHDLSELLLSFKYAVPHDITQTLTQPKPEDLTDPDVIEVEATEDLPSFLQFGDEKLNWNQMIELQKSSDAK